MGFYFFQISISEKIPVGFYFFQKSLEKIGLGFYLRGGIFNPMVLVSVSDQKHKTDAGNAGKLYQFRELNQVIFKIRYSL